VPPPTLYQQQQTGQKRKPSYAQIATSATSSTAAEPQKSPSARRTRFGPKSSAATAKASNAQTNNGWPPSLQRYVEKAFQFCDKSKKAQVEEYLKKRISDTEGKLFSVDWDNEPLPLGGGRPSGLPVQFGKRKGRRFDITKSAFSLEDQPGSSKKKRKKKNKQKKRSELMMVLNEFESKKRDDRRSRFKDYFNQQRSGSSSQYNPFSTRSSNYALTGDLALDWENLKIVGTCEKLEKGYLRLTSAPDPTKVRPLHVLKKTYAMLCEKWKEEKDYIYINDQFRSLRQDLLIQNIKNEFTVKAYETHSRITIESGDLLEFNQCQTQLKYLYSLKEEHKKNYVEFMCYKVLYLVATDHNLDLMPLLKHEIASKDRGHIAIRFAMDVMAAYHQRNWACFFRLVKNAPYDCGFITERLATRLRLHALKAIVKASKVAKVPVGYLARTLNFKTEEACIEYVTSCGAKLDQSKQKLLPKESTDLHPPENV